jgi:type II secretory pathway component GspD/PulD (secretin)
MKKISLIIMLSVLLSMIGCDSNDTKTITPNVIDVALLETQSPIVFRSEPTPASIIVKTFKDARLTKNISVAIKQPINIIAAIDFADNTLSTSIDTGVDLNKQFVVNFKKQTLENYFNYLENITGYSINLVNSIVYVRSIKTKTWNLQTLSLKTVQIQTNSKTDIKSDSSTPSANNQINQHWQDIVNHVEIIMSGGESSDKSDKDTKSADTNKSNSSNNNLKAIVTNNQRLGTITAIGLPTRIKQVDFWLNNLINASNRQIHLQVQVLDVSVDESVGQGINWNLISEQSSGFQIGNDVKQVIDGAGIISIGTPMGAIIDLGKSISLDVMLNLLREQGKVRVDNQPNITVTNGHEAYITTGDQFSYVSSINSTPDATGNVVTTSEIERMSVGVDMRVTPKILPDNRIVVSIVPIISSIKSFTTLTSGSDESLQEFQTPNIALQKLSTQVIVESGKTIHLGGLIASKVANAVKGLPNEGVMDIFFKGVQKSLERREIVILVTPTIVR